MRKSPSPKIAPSKFEPELVSTMRSVLDAAVDQIAVANRTHATKAKMARCIRWRYGASDVNCRRD
jgi:hypothetical protein